MAANGLPLEGVRVVDFSHLMPGPWAAQMLGDLGADVIKVERTGMPDGSRANPPSYEHETVYFHSNNRNKRSIALDLGVEADAAVARDLIARADVMIESFRPGVTARLKIDYAAAAAANPGIIYCSVTGFGSSGPLASTPGHDAMLLAEAGILDMADLAGTPPMPRIQAADWAASAFAVMGIMAAYIRRGSTGAGVMLEVPIYNSILSWSSIKLSSALARLAGHSGLPALESFGTNPRYTTYRTCDGKAVTVALLEARSWAHFCAVIGRPDLVYEDETPADRHKTSPERSARFRAALEELCGSHDRDDLVAWMQRENVAITPVLNPDEAVALAQQRGALAFVDHPRDGRVPFFVDPLARAGLSDPLRQPSPAVDEHGDEIRAELASGDGPWGRPRTGS